MSSKGVNTSEDTDMTDCDGEKVVTMMDVLQEQQDFEEDANAVLGASDDKNCTFSKGYIKRQAVYACMTCCSGAKEDEIKRAGVCLACSLSCHENHEMIELYTKRNFRCDCGNPKFNSHPCQFNQNKNDINEDNKYNQNYSGLYCICHRPYPDPDSKVQDEMIQCVICEDWLHASHLDAVVPPNFQYSEMICKGCVEQNLFLHDYSEFAVTAENADVDVTISNDHTSDNLIETSKDNLEHNMSVEDFKINYKTEDNNMKDDANGDTSTITEFGGITDNEGVAQIKMECISDTVINAENEIKEKDKIDSTTKVDAKEEVNTSHNYSLTTQNVPEKINPNNSQEDAKTDEKLNKMSFASSMENESEVRDKDLDTTETLLDKNDSEMEEEKLLYEEETSNNIENKGDAKMQAVEKSEENIVENKQDEDGKTNTETPTEEQPKDELNVTPESKNSEINKNTKKIDRQEIKDVKDTEPEITKISSKAETVDPNASDLNVTNPVIDNENKTKAEPKGNNLTEENPPIIDKCTKENDNEIKEDLSKVENTTEENEMQEENQTVNQPEESGVNAAKLTDHSYNENNVPHSTITNTHDNKRKLSVDEVKDNVVMKKLKSDEAKACVKPKDGKKHLKGATFWPTSFRQKLCTCNQCLAMYKDLSVLFLIDPEDTVSAYEMLGKEKTEGSPSSQYEKGLQALSSLDRIQQINALTEYNKMRDKLLDFLKSFKDRREIVKEEDIKGFFAGMKPKREPDGVYFCR